MRDLIRNIKLEKADYRKIAEKFDEFMEEVTDGIEDSMIKQVPKFAELDQSRNIVINNIENALEESHFDMFQQYQHIMGEMQKIQYEVYFCLGMKFANKLGI